MLTKCRRVVEVEVKLQLNVLILIRSDRSALSLIGPSSTANHVTGDISRERKSLTVLNLLLLLYYFFSTLILLVVVSAGGGTNKARWQLLSLVLRSLHRYYDIHESRLYISLCNVYFSHSNRTSLPPPYYLIPLSPPWIFSSLPWHRPSRRAARSLFLSETALITESQSGHSTMVQRGCVLLGIQFNCGGI